jgi:alpha-ketoglutarate-dependent taurine dioxygenase
MPVSALAENLVIFFRDQHITPAQHLAFGRKFGDNRCTRHRAMWDYWPHTRAGARVTVKGERPV